MSYMVQVTSNISWRRHADHIHICMDSPWSYETGSYHICIDAHQPAEDVDVVPSMGRRAMESEGVVNEEPDDVPTEPAVVEPKESVDEPRQKIYPQRVCRPSE